MCRSGEAQVTAAGAGAGEQNQAREQQRQAGPGEELGHPRCARAGRTLQLESSSPVESPSHPLLESSLRVESPSHPPLESSLACTGSDSMRGLRVGAAAAAAAVIRVGLVVGFAAAARAARGVVVAVRAIRDRRDHDRLRLRRGFLPAACPCPACGVPHWPAPLAMHVQRARRAQRLARTAELLRPAGAAERQSPHASSRVPVSPSPRVHEREREAAVLTRARRVECDLRARHHDLTLDAARAEAHVLACELAIAGFELRRRRIVWPIGRHVELDQRAVAVLRTNSKYMYRPCGA